MEATADEAGFGRREQLLAGLLAPLGPGHPHRHTITIRIRGVLDTIGIVILAVSEVNPQSGAALTSTATTSAPAPVAPPAAAAERCSRTPGAHLEVPCRPDRHRSSNPLGPRRPAA